MLDQSAMFKDLKFVMFTKSECKWCKKAADLMHSRHIKFFQIDATKGDAFLFLTTSGLRTVPQIYANGFKVGGYEELAELLGEPLPEEPEVSDDEAYGAMVYHAKQLER